MINLTLKQFQKHILVDQEEARLEISLAYRTSDKF